MLVSHMRVDGRGEAYGVLHLRGQIEETLAELLIRETQLSETRIFELIKLGSVYLNGRRHLTLETRIDDSSSVRIHTTPRRFETSDLRARVVFEAADYLLLDKPSGIPVHPLTDNAFENVLAVLQTQLSRPLFITHRLDVETSGLLVIALDAEAQARINSQIAERKVKRLYKAVVECEIAVGEFTHYMKPSPTAPKEVSSERIEGWVECRLRITDCSARDENFELKIELLTGRTQQIRAQLAALGAPILGDSIYGGSSKSQTPRAIALRAYSIVIDDRIFVL